MEAFRSGGSSSNLGGLSPGAFGIDPAQLAGLDFSDRSSTSGVLLGVNVACIVLVTITVSLRLWARVGITGKLFVDDSKQLIPPPWLGYQPPQKSALLSSRVPVLLIFAAGFTLAICAISTAGKCDSG
jgi:hypothetical protein